MWGWFGLGGHKTPVFDGASRAFVTVTANEFKQNAPSLLLMLPGVAGDCGNPHRDAVGVHRVRAGSRRVDQFNSGAAEREKILPLCI